jgi:hypothetical protein
MREKLSTRKPEGKTHFENRPTVKVYLREKE